MENSKPTKKKKEKRKKKRKKKGKVAIPEQFVYLYSTL